MITQIGQIVKVRAEFEAGRLRPLLFSWQNREHRVEKVDFIHTQQKGAVLVYYFSLTGPTARYYLSFDTRTFIWRLLSVEA